MSFETELRRALLNVFPRAKFQENECTSTDVWAELRDGGRSLQIHLRGEQRDFGRMHYDCSIMIFERGVWVDPNASGDSENNAVQAVREAVSGGLERLGSWELLLKGELSDENRGR